MFLQDFDHFNGPATKKLSILSSPCNLFIMYFYYVN